MSDDAGRAASDPVRPADLELADDRVRRLDDDRYVVRVDDDADAGTDAVRESRESTSDGTNPLDDLDGAHALCAHARTETGEDALRVETNDVSRAFESFLRWYAGRVAPDEPPEVALAVLLSNASLDLAVDPGGR
ncbi:DUF7500 family protein [Halarchaeum nitratireducens]|nr:hypothetical protein [Halarchaeum nitratireducens]